MEEFPEWCPTITGRRFKPEGEREPPKPKKPSPQVRSKCNEYESAAGHVRNHERRCRKCKKLA